MLHSLGQKSSFHFHQIYFLSSKICALTEKKLTISSGSSRSTMISWPVKDSFHSGHRRCKDKLVGGLGPSKITAVAANRMIAWAFHLLYFMCAFNSKVEKKQEMKPVNIKETRRQTEKRTKRVNTPVSHNRSGLGVGTSRHPKGE